MNIPGYDAWRLQGPEEDDRDDENDDAEEYALGLGDYLYERKRDREMEEI